MAAKVLFSYEDLLQTPDDGKRYEIVDGDLLVSPAPRPRHQRTLGKTYRFVMRAEDAGYGELFFAPLDVVFDAHNVMEPDLLFIRKDRLSIITDTNVEGPPDLVVEVLSPGGRERDLGVKLRAYARFGVPYYWVLDTDAQIVRVFELERGVYGKPKLLEGDDLHRCPLFPELSTPVASLFA
jgi:Uma2 family endonuclease